MSRSARDEVQSMAGLRVQIGAVDAALMDVLAERSRYTERTSGLKAMEGLSAAATGRTAQAQQTACRVTQAREVDDPMVAALGNGMIDTIIGGEEAGIGKPGVGG